MTKINVHSFLYEKLFRPVSHMVWSADMLEFPKFKQVKELAVAVSLLGPLYTCFSWKK